MAISIDRVYKTVLFLANSDVRGNVTPSELRLAINDVVNEIYESYLYEVNKAVNRENRGLINGGLENIADRLREKINHFLKEANLTHSGGFYTLPSDLRYFDSVFYNGTNEVEVCRNAKEFKLLSSNIYTNPTSTYPIYLKTENKIKILPATIITNVSIFYLRNPKIAKWTYTIVSGAELYNPSALDFQDIDLHPSEEYTVVLKTLNRFGINLKEQDIQAIAQNKEILDTNEQVITIN